MEITQRSYVGDVYGNTLLARALPDMGMWVRVRHSQLGKGHVRGITFLSLIGCWTCMYTVRLTSAVNFSLGSELFASFPHHDYMVSACTVSGLCSSLNMVCSR